MNESVDQEIEAIKAVLAALTPLSGKARASVLDYVSKRLDLPTARAQQNVPDTSGAEEIPGAPLVRSEVSTSAPTHIKNFKEQKKPRSANEMAAVVAYYLANHAQSDQRKNTVNQKDVETYFKIAGFPLPHQVRVTLRNAKNAGYFDLAGEGEYRLNAVGHNLVVHSMPRGKSSGTGSRGRRRKLASAKTHKRQTKQSAKKSA